MNNFSTLLLIVLVAVVLADDDPWLLYKKLYGVKTTNAAEDQYRLATFKATVDKINRHNANPKRGHVEGVSPYSYLPYKEFAEIYFGFKAPKQATVLVPSAPPALLTWPAITFSDWTKNNRTGTVVNYITAARNQGQCGSCWAFSAVAAIESLYTIFKGAANNNSTDFSEQQLVDCDTTNSGCNGGMMNRAFTYIQSKAKGIVLESKYLYTGKKGTCKSITNLQRFTISGYLNVGTSCDSLANAVAVRPISVALHASPAWQNYKSGALSNCSKPINHGVLLVGYNKTDAFTLIWRIKNSWGTSWGMNGFIHLNASSPTNGSTCGICNIYACYPL